VPGRALRRRPAATAAGQSAAHRILPADDGVGEGAGVSGLSIVGRGSPLVAGLPFQLAQHLPRQGWVGGATDAQRAAA
jgi:hypothetical protein